MTYTVSIEDAEGKLRELIDQLAPGDELIITKNSQPIAALTSKSQANPTVRKPGLGKGMIKIVSEDNDHLTDFSEYMP